MLVEKDGNGCGEMKVHTGEVHLVQKVQSEGDRRLQGGGQGQMHSIVVCRMTLEIKKRR